MRVHAYGDVLPRNVEKVHIYNAIERNSELNIIYIYIIMYTYRRADHPAKAVHSDCHEPSHIVCH